MPSRSWIIGGIMFMVVHIFESCDFNTYAQGKVLYDKHCSPCHMNDGSGLSLLYPSLMDTKRLRTIQSEIPCMIKNGVAPVDSIPNSGMTAFPNLSEIEISNIINYINTQLAGGIDPVTFLEINAFLKKCESG